MAGGYYHTGDVASRDADGYITYIGRTDDVFKASDYKISPFELESVLIEHPAVAEAAVVPAPDPVRLAVPKAYVALAARLRADARRPRWSILAHAREQPGALPARPPARVRRAAEDDLRQDPPRRAARPRGAGSPTVGTGGRRVPGRPVPGAQGGALALSPGPHRGIARHRPIVARHAPVNRWRVPTREAVPGIGEPGLVTGAKADQRSAASRHGLRGRHLPRSHLARLRHGVTADWAPERGVSGRGIEHLRRGLVEIRSVLAVLL